MDFKELGSRLGIDEEDFMELVELFVTTSLGDIDKIKAGMSGNTPADAAAAAHSIKGAAGNMGFDSIFELAKEMEMKAKQGDLQLFDTMVSDLENQVNGLTEN